MRGGGARSQSASDGAGPLSRSAWSALVLAVLALVAGATAAVDGSAAETASTDRPPAASAPIELADGPVPGSTNAARPAAASPVSDDPPAGGVEPAGPDEVEPLPPTPSLLRWSATPEMLVGRALEAPIDRAFVWGYAVAAAVWPSFGCDGDWPLLVAIGEVESQHGHAAGPDATIDDDGTVRPEIRGPVLDGTRWALIPDTDGGQWDGDDEFDRAVGPMQFIPSTWAVHGLDANGDGRADPHNVHDATLSAAAYLCASVGAGDLTQEAIATQALLAYNPDESYVRRVLDIADGYRTGTPGIRSQYPELLPLGTDPREVVQFDEETGAVVLGDDGRPVLLADAEPVERSGTKVPSTTTTSTTSTTTTSTPPPATTDPGSATG